MGQIKFIIELAKSERRERGAGFILGRTWDYLQTIFYILILSSAIVWGVRESFSPKDWFEQTSGLLAWFFFNEVITHSLLSIKERSYFLKKFNVPYWVFPFAKALIAFEKHFIFLFLLIVYQVVINGPDLNLLLLLCLPVTLFLFSFYTALVIAPLATVFKDITPLTSHALQIMFWMSPIIWTDYPNNLFFKIVEYLPTSLIVDLYQTPEFNSSNLIKLSIFLVWLGGFGVLSTCFYYKTKLKIADFL